MRILLVEDEAKVAAFITKGLREERYIVDVATTGPEGEYLAAINEYDLLILDRMLPGKEGLEICRDLRRKGIRVPILILTARDSVQDRVAGLDCGADDYLVKPFAFEELLARLRALLRREGTRSPLLTVGDLELDPASHEVRRGGNAVELTQREYALLEYLVRHPDQILSRSTLLEHVWEAFEHLDSNVIDVYITYLRQKIDKGHDRKLIHTVRGAGYMLRTKDV